MHYLSFSRMSEIPESLKVDLRGLTLGRDAVGMWQWSYQDGSCWAAILSDEDGPIAWAALTNQVDPFPVVGVYCDEEHRGKGLATVVSRHLLSMVDLPKKTPVYAVSSYWQSWPEVLDEFGLVHFEWS